MFKSSQNLRLAAEMRALERVASPWRETRTEWFDGTPDSVQARIAATDRVLAYARSGFTPAHLELTKEAEAARRELTAALDRWMVDPIDDTVRKTAIRWDGKRKASRRSAGAFDEAEFAARAESELDPEMRGNYYDGPSSDDCRHCGERIEERGDGSYGHVLGQDRNTGWTTFYPEDDHPAEPDSEDYHTAGRHDPDDFRPWKNTVADEPYFSMMPTPNFEEIPLDGDYEGRHRAEASLRVAAHEFVDAQGGLTDPQELSYRAARHVTERTGQWSAADQQKAVRAFTGAVLKAASERPAPKMVRTSSTLPDFADHLLFDS